MTFTPEMYERIRAGASASAAVVVPLVLDVFLRPEGKLSVVDVGCGEGLWAREFARAGCAVVAIDREIVSEARDGVYFIRMALPAESLGGRYDLAVCLEVAEHLPAQDADLLVQRLVEIAPVVLFSAAIPGQGGHGHLNEQPPGYWADLFAAHSYLPVDCLRRELWDDERVEPWYRQNTLFYAAEGHELLRHPGLAAFDLCRPLPLVHPAIFEWRLAELRELRGA